jgi:hypothetical protein
MNLEKADLPSFDIEPLADMTGDPAALFSSAI